MSANLRRIVSVVCMAALPVLALAAAKSAIDVTNAYTMTSPTLNAAGYFTITSGADDAITGAASECCTAVELHQHSMDGPVMKMGRVDSVPLPAGEKVEFAPHGYHLMLIGLKAPLAIGGHIPVTLKFEHAAPKPIVLIVRKQV